MQVKKEKEGGISCRSGEKNGIVISPGYLKISGGSRSALLEHQGRLCGGMRGKKTEERKTERLLSRHLGRDARVRENRSVTLFLSGEGGGIPPFEQRAAGKRAGKRYRQRESTTDAPSSAAHNNGGKGEPGKGVDAPLIPAYSKENNNVIVYAPKGTGGVLKGKKKDNSKIDSPQRSKKRGRSEEKKIKISSLKQQQKAERRSRGFPDRK